MNIGDFSNISGEENVVGESTISIQQITTTGLSPAEIKQFFNQLYTAIETNAKASRADKEELKADMKEIQFTVTEPAKNNEKANEGLIGPQFRNIMRTAPNLLDVVVAPLRNSVLELRVAIKKIVEKAKEETNRLSIAIYVLRDCMRQERNKP